MAHVQDFFNKKYSKYLKKLQILPICSLFLMLNLEQWQIQSDKWT